MDEVLLSSFEGSTTGHGHGHAVIASFSQAIVAPSRTTLEDYLAFLAQQGAASMKEVVQGMQQLHTQTLNLTQKDLYGNRERQSHLARGIQICRDQFRTAKEILEHLRRGIVNEVKSITQVGPELIDWIQATAKTTEVILRKLLHTPLIRDYSDLIPTLSWLSVDFIYIFLRIRRKLILSESEQHYKRNIDQCLDTITSLLWSGLYHRNLIIPVLAWKPPIATQEDAFTTLFEYVSVVAQTTTKSWIVDPKQRDFDSNLSDKRVTTVCGALASLVSVATDTKNGDRNSESNAVDDDTAYQFMELVKKKLSPRAYLMWLQCFESLLQSPRFHEQVSSLSWKYNIQEYLLTADTHTRALVNRIHEVLYVGYYSRERKNVDADEATNTNSSDKNAGR